MDAVLAKGDKHAAHAGIPVEDAKSFKEQKEDPLYADRVQIYPKAISGIFPKDQMGGADRHCSAFTT